MMSLRRVEPFAVGDGISAVTGCRSPRVQEVPMRCVRMLGRSLVGAVGSATLLGAQSFHGTLRLDDRTSPAPNARVWLATSTGATVDTARSNDRGEFVLTAPHAGR